VLFVRIYGRLIGLVLWTMFSFALWVCFWPIVAITGNRLSGVLRRCIQVFGWGATTLLGIKVKVEGKPPKPPFCLVANHVGYVDIFVIARITGSLFVAKADMADWPIFGFIGKHSRIVYINREQMRDTQRVIGAVKEVLAHGDGVTIFPEAGCSRGDAVPAFKPAMFQPAAELNMPVHWAAITYETPEGCPAASDTVAWWRWEPLMDHLKRMFALPRFTATVRFCDRPVTQGDRKVRALQCHRGVAAAFTPLKQGILPELPRPLPVAPAPRWKEVQQAAARRIPIPDKAKDRLVSIRRRMQRIKAEREARKRIRKAG